ncbi:hypothetical protein VN12_23040 [Pirellula sp. SH-Sr6A]|uniref:hypothetical protein n=1 Tax=Pirellula sp. SH-Sr6A TaxID=1632865 RepID=UPI00078DF576|nr:hypothetical protein [Pirellula sp. SH-Sr6A]AMV35021.1 hypothetical protein VN12_23040 [Pirellula sp. SH-Sr6A]
MSDRISLRTLLASIAAIAGLMMLLRLAIIQSDGTALRVLLCVIAVPLFTFALFALCYALTLPFGVLTQITRESLAPAQSPFAQDRLPESLVPHDDEVK